MTAAAEATAWTFTQHSHCASQNTVIGKKIRSMLHNQWWCWRWKKKMCGALCVTEQSKEPEGHKLGSHLWWTIVVSSWFQIFRNGLLTLCHLLKKKLNSKATQQSVAWQHLTVPPSLPRWSKTKFNLGKPSRVFLSLRVNVTLQPRLEDKTFHVVMLYSAHFTPPQKTSWSHSLGPGLLFDF